MIEEKRDPIALLDSGVGGLTVAREIIRFIPGKRIVYFGDTLHLPYGPRKRKEVEGFVFKIIDYLISEKRAGAIVIACNTASAFVLKKAQRFYAIPIFGTLIGACQKAVQESNKHRIAVIGTEGTIGSGAYQQALLELRPDLQIFVRACPRFVELVEAGQLSGDKIVRTAHYYLDDLREKDIDVLILGCTHFPYLMPVIRRVMGKGVNLINPAVEVAKEVKGSLNLSGNIAVDLDMAGHEFMVSDKKKVSKLFLSEGRKYLELCNLNFTERNIFIEEEEDGR